MKCTIRQWLPLTLAALVLPLAFAGPSPFAESPSAPGMTETLVGTQSALVFVRAGDVWIMNTDGSAQTKLTQLGSVTQARLASGTVVFLSNGCLNSFALQGFNPLASPVLIPSTCGALEFDLSPDASKIVLTYGTNANTQLYTVNLDGSSLTLINGWGDHHSGPAWSRSGKVFFVRSAIGNAFSQVLYSIPENGVNNSTQLTGYFSQYPASGGPADRLAFLWDHPVKRIRIANPDGSGQFDVPGVDAGDGSYMGYDYEQEVIYYTRYGVAYRVNIDGSGNTLLTQGVFSGVDYGRVPLPDTTAPVINRVVSGTGGQAGWFRSDVTVSWTISDPESSITSSTGCSPVTLTAETQGVTLTCSATNAFGLTASLSVTVKIDKTPPVLSSSRSPVANANGWNNTNVAVNFSCYDALSGGAIPSPLATILSGEGAGQSASSACTDLAGNSALASVTGINIDKTPPVVASVTVSPNPLAVNTAAILSAALTDSGGSALASAEYSVNGGNPVAITGVTGDSVTATAAIGPYPTPGVYTVCTTSRDLAGNPSAEDCILLPVYDSTGGFVTGGGSINSPLGAYAANPSLTGKANFGFVSKYEPGASIPSGETQFHFQVAGFRFKSASYDWLVVAGARAQYKGTGTVNGAGNYQFLLTAIDGNLSGGGGTDRFRLKIWTDQGVVYDNNSGADDNADPSTSLSAGSIVIHK